LKVLANLFLKVSW